MTAAGLARTGAAISASLAVLGLAGWLSGRLGLASFGPALIPMAPSTAIGFLLLAASIVVRLIPTRWSRAAGAAAVATLVALAAIKLAEFATGLHAFDLERWFFPVPDDFGSVPLGRMSPLTAVAFLVQGGGAAWCHRRGWRRDVAGGLAACSLFEVVTVLLGYGFGAPLLYGGTVIPMALPTALAFVGSGVAIVAVAGVDAWPARPFVGGSARARLLRTLLPFTIAAVLLGAAGAQWLLGRANLNPALFAAVVALATAAAAGLVVSAVAKRVGHAIDDAERVLERSRQDLERLVAQRTAELTALNKELESFGYSVAHDLRAPLRHVAGFASLVQETALERLTPDEVDSLRRVIAGADRMGGMIDALLALSRVTRQPVALTRLSLGSVVDAARAEVAPLEAEREIEWHIHPALPDVDGDAVLLRLALVNLLSNAVKYTSQRSVARIEVGLADGPWEEVVLFVRDNGAGFDMAHAARLFGAFQRLHDPRQFAGIGVGLANVARIAARHGGRVWAEATPDIGATFFLALRRSLP